MNENKMAKKAGKLTVGAGELVKRMVENDNLSPGVQIRAAIALNQLANALHQINALYAYIDEAERALGKKNRNLLSILTGGKYGN